jgi:hypothetical protein
MAAIALVVGAACMTQLTDIGTLLTTDKSKQGFAWWIIALVLLILAAGALWLTHHPHPHGTGFLSFVLAGIIASALILLAALRVRERADPIPPLSQPDPLLVHILQDWEDLRISGSDHMGSVVIIKPGRLRAFLIRFAMRALYLLVRLTARDGYLGAMRTIHFAHWAIVDHGKRLLFLSNFDGSWESYLDDFIEKAHGGLTLAWGNCTGFPPAKYLWLDGATKGREFKAWARCSMAPNRLWYSAYPDLTVNQIVRQAAIAQGLCAPTLSGDDATAWAREL